MRSLTDTELMHAYIKTVEQNLNPHFLQLLEEEMKRHPKFFICLKRIDLLAKGVR